MGITFRHVYIFDIRIGDHRLIYFIQIDHNFGEIFGITIRGKSRFFAGFYLHDALFRLIKKRLEHLDTIVHAMINHAPDTILGDLKGFNEGLVIRNTYGSFRLHLGSPVCKGEGLIRQQCSNMDFDDAPLEDVLAKLI